ncbi:MAG: hypothetical protein AB8B85_12900 [Paracoccaceae bacterium]
MRTDVLGISLRRISALLLGITLATPAAFAADNDKADIQLSSGNIVLSNKDGTQISMAPGSDVSLGRDADGVAVITLNSGDVYLSNVLQSSGEPIRLRMGDQVVEIDRASVMVSRAEGKMDVTLLHGRQVNFSAGGPALTQAGTRLSIGRGAPRTDRPSAAQMAAMKGAVGSLAPFGKPAGKRQGGAQRPPQAAAPPSAPQARVPGQIRQQGDAQSVVSKLPLASDGGTLMDGGKPPKKPGDMGMKPPVLPPDIGMKPPEMPDHVDMGGMDPDIPAPEPPQPEPEFPFFPNLPPLPGA